VKKWDASSHSLILILRILKAILSSLTPRGNSRKCVQGTRCHWDCSFLQNLPSQSHIQIPLFLQQCPKLSGIYQENQCIFEMFGGTGKLQCRGMVKLPWPTRTNSLALVSMMLSTPWRPPWWTNVADRVCFVPGQNSEGPKLLHFVPNGWLAGVSDIMVKLVATISYRMHEDDMPLLVPETATFVAVYLELIQVCDFCFHISNDASCQHLQRAG
jgi:hypothetical protein